MVNILMPKKLKKLLHIYFSIHLKLEIFKSQTINKIQRAMKKQLLMIVAVAVSVSANAQNKHMLNTSKQADSKIKPASFEPAPANTPVPVIAHKGGANATTGTQNLSTGPNGFGMSGEARNIIWADPTLNTVAFIHRNRAAESGFGISGDLNTDFSTDGGLTFTLNHKVYNGAATAGPLFPARYPSGGMYNPAGNTVGANAFMTAVGPTLDGSNLSGSWGGYANGSNMLTAGSTAVSSDTPSDGANGFFQYIPFASSYNKTGNAVVVSQAIDLTGTGDYTDNLIYYNGTWAAGSYNYNRTLFPFPVSSNIDGSKLMSSFKVAFGDDGLHGYMVALAHNDYTLFPDSAYYPIVYKTVDGGTTWSGPIDINISALETTIPALTGTGNLVSTSFECDAVVDANNNLHVVTGACAGADGFSIFQGAGASSIVDIYTTDGGTTWFGQALGVPMTGRGNYGDGSSTNATLSQDNAPQATRSWDGTKLMFTWLDTDTLSFAGIGNVQPDVWACAYDVTTNMWTATSNRTPGLATFMFGNAAYYALENAGTYTVPVAFQVIDGTTGTGQPLNTGGPVQYGYNDDVTFTATDFTVAGTPIPLVVANGINTIESVTTSNVTVVPNPAVGSAKIAYLLNSTSDVTVKIVNMVGATVKELSFPSQSVGVHDFKLDLTGYNQGVYFVNVTSNGNVSTTKFVVK